MTTTIPTGRAGRPNPPFHTHLHSHPQAVPGDRDGGRNDVPLHRRLARRGARDRPRSCGRSGRTPRRRPHDDQRVPCRPGTSTTCTSSSCRSCSAEACASGTGSRASRRSMRSRTHTPRPAVSRNDLHACGCCLKTALDCASVRECCPRSVADEGSPDRHSATSDIKV